MPLPLPTATIRTQVSVPLRFADGYATAARVFTFDGLVDGREHLAFGLGDRSEHVTPPAPADLAAAATAADPAAQRVPDRRRVRQPALRLRPAAARGGRAHRRLRRLPAVPAPGGSRHRPVREARRLRAAGHGARHVRGQPRARPRSGRAQLPGRRADAARPRCVARRPAQQQSGQGPAAAARSGSPSPSAYRPACTCRPRTPATWRRRRAGASTRSTSRCRPADPARYRVAPNAFRKRSRNSFIGHTGAFGSGRRPSFQPHAGDLIQHRRVVGDDRDRHVVADAALIR